MSETEKWRPVKDYEGLYEVSDLGRVRSVAHKLWNGKGYFVTQTKIIKPRKKCWGYMSVALSKNGKAKEFKVHRLVAEMFIPNPHKFPQINHKDECKTNNKVSNLEWCTAKYNTNYGSRNKRAGLNLRKPVYQFDAQGKFVKLWDSVNSLAACDYLPHYISLACKGKTKTAYGFIWRHEGGVKHDNKNVYIREFIQN